jgi:hypothetical protein
MAGRDARPPGSGIFSVSDATLNVTGTDPEGAKAQGTVHMVLENRQWKVEKESWKSEN